LWDTALPTAWQRALREGRPLGLVLLEVDRWVHFRAHHGQLAADRCLQAVAVALQQASPDPNLHLGEANKVGDVSVEAPIQPAPAAAVSASASDVALIAAQRSAPWLPIRLADDRFALLLWAASVAEATVQAQRWHAAVTDLAVLHGGQDGFLAVSVSAVSVQPVRGSAPDDLLRAADIALQCAVRQGGNQVVSGA
jgi:PleD family two-component response regulator